MKKHINISSRLKLLISLLVITPLIAACGGGGSGTPAAAPTTFTVSSTAGDNGTITIATSSSIASGSKGFLTVTPNTNFVIGSVSGCSGTLDGNTYTTGAVTADCTVTATFISASATTFTVSATAGDNGTISPPSSVIASGSTGALTVTPNSSFVIGSVSGCAGSLDGNTYTTGAVTANCSVIATFISASATTFTVSATAGDNGTISPPSSVIVSGSTGVLTVTPNSDFAIGSVSGCAGSLNGNTYTTGAVTANCSVIATFVAAPTTFTVSATAGANGTISPTSSDIASGSTGVLTVTPNSDFVIDSVSGCGAGNLDGNTYTTGAVTADCAVTASFVAAAPTTFTVSATAGDNGAITPTSSDIASGSTGVLTVTPDSNFAIDSVTGCDGSIDGNTYTTGAVTADCAVTASFVASVFNITTSAGANGTIASGKTVTAGSTTSFIVQPLTGFRVSGLSGCNGEYDGGTKLYTTGPVNADCAIAALFDPIETDLTVAPRYPTNGANWNDYVTGNATAATGAACNASDNVPCIHGGELKVVAVTGKSTCTDLTATDSLAAFNWQCVVDNGTAHFVSTGLADDKHLSSLLDNSAAPDFEDNRVIVQYQGADYATSTPSKWWTNPVTTQTASTSLSTSSVINVVTSNINGTFTISADKVALVIMPDFTIGTGNSSSEVISATNQDFIWFEGKVDAAGNNKGVSLTSVKYSTLRNVSSDNVDDNNNNNDDYGIYLTSSSYNRLENVTTNGTVGGGGGNSSIGIKLRNNSSNNKLENLIVNTHKYGITLNSDSNTLTGVSVTDNSDLSIEIDSADENTLNTVTVSGGRYGIYIQNSATTNTFNDLTVSNSTSTGSTGAGVYLSRVTGNTFNTIDSSGHQGNGIYLRGSPSNTFNNVTANNNVYRGVYLRDYDNNNDDKYSDSNTFATFTATGNATGIELTNSSANTFSDLNITGNTSANCIVDTPSGTDGGRTPSDPGLDSNCTITGTTGTTTPSINGLALYDANCSGCHGTAPGTKSGRSATVIQDAMINNSNHNSRSNLTSLTFAEIEAIAAAIAP
jgi:parallel beta-helix repeat protein